MSKTAGFGVSEFFVQRPCGREKSAGVRCVATAAVLVTFADKSHRRSLFKGFWPLWAVKVTVNALAGHRGRRPLQNIKIMQQVRADNIRPYSSE